MVRFWSVPWCVFGALRLPIRGVFLERSVVRFWSVCYLKPWCVFRVFIARGDFDSQPFVAVSVGFGPANAVCCGLALLLCGEVENASLHALNVAPPRGVLERSGDVRAVNIGQPLEVTQRLSHRLSPLAALAPVDGIPEQCSCHANDTSALVLDQIVKEHIGDVLPCHAVLPALVDVTWLQVEALELIGVIRVAVLIPAKLIDARLSALAFALHPRFLHAANESLLRGFLDGRPHGAVSDAAVLLQVVVGELVLLVYRLARLIHIAKGMANHEIDEANALNGAVRMENGEDLFWAVEDV